MRVVKIRGDIHVYTCLHGGGPLHSRFGWHSSCVPLPFASKNSGKAVLPQAMQTDEEMFFVVLATSWPLLAVYVGLKNLNLTCVNLMLT